VFRELRKLDEYSAEELDNSLNPIKNKEQMSKIRESEGKSGSFFFFSHDNRFLIKTITNKELNTIIGKFMESYHDYITNNPDSIIARVYGVYTIIIKYDSFF
jgi:Phosphatidylinositol-4-phosphate 5-Kinase